MEADIIEIIYFADDVAYFFDDKNFEHLETFLNARELSR